MLDTLPYFDKESAFFNNENSYWATFPYVLDNHKAFVNLFGIKIGSIINTVLKNLKPGENMLIKHESVKNHNKLFKYGKTLECCEMQSVMNKSFEIIEHDIKKKENNNSSNENNEQKNENISTIDYDTVQVSNSNIWLVFKSFNMLQAITNINLSDLKITLPQKSQIILECDQEHPLQLQWSRNNKLMSLNDFYFKTISNS